MNIKEYIKDCYEVAQEKGFYPNDSKIEDHLMGIVSELGEAYEAHRGGKFAKLGEVIQFVGKVDFDTLLRGFEQGLQGPKQYYVDHLSGTFEDEIADVFIRLFNLCGWLGIEDLKISDSPKIQTEITPCLKLLTIGSYVFNINKIPLRFDEEDKKELRGIAIRECLNELIRFCVHLGIDYIKHIQAKHEFNKTREHLHGKKY